MNPFLSVLYLVSIIALVVLPFSSCTYNISMIHTQGEATDVIDNNQKTEGEVSPSVSSLDEIL